jgi:hypothetical protein
LSRRGILYPLEERQPGEIRAYANSHFRLFVLLRRQAMVERGDGDAAQLFWEKNRLACGFFKSLDDLLDAYDRRMSRMGASKLLISAEDLFDLHTTDETRFEEKWLEAAAGLLAKQAQKRGYRPKVVVYLRRQDHLLAAHYSQWIKGSASHHEDFKTFARSFAPRLRSLELLGHWSRAFGAENILVRPYERRALREGIVPDFFEKVLGFPPPPDWRRPPADPETVNRSPSRDFIEFIRDLNLRLGENQTEFPRRWVLQAALQEPEGDRTKLSDWFSASEQSDFLKTYAGDNSKIALEFLKEGAGELFMESTLEQEGIRAGYPGLSRARQADIAGWVRKLRSRDRFLRRALRALFVFALLLLLGWMLRWMRAT